MNIKRAVVLKIASGMHHFPNTSTRTDRSATMHDANMLALLNSLSRLECNSLCKVSAIFWLFTRCTARGVQHPAFCRTNSVLFTMMGICNWMENPNRRTAPK